MVFEKLREEQDRENPEMLKEKDKRLEENRL